MADHLCLFPKGSQEALCLETIHPGRITIEIEDRPVPNQTKIKTKKEKEIFDEEACAVELVLRYGIGHFLCIRWISVHYAKWSKASA